MICSLSKQEFDQLLTTPATSRSVLRKAVEWFADDTGLVVGAIALHDSNLWSFVVLRHVRGAFRAMGLDYGFNGPDHARRLLRARMERTLVSNSAESGDVYARRPTRSRR
jgi:hypothetical protein